MIHIPSTLSRTDGFDLADAGDPQEGADLPQDGGSGDTAWSGKPLGGSDAMARLGELLHLHRGLQAYAYRAPGGGGGAAQPQAAGAAAPNATVTQAEVLKEMKGGFVDTRNLGQPLQQALADAGVDPKDLARLADKQGRVGPDKLFAFIDRFDSNRKAGSFAATTTDASGATVPTKAGALYEALRKEVDANRMVANHGSSAAQFGKLAAGHGVLDVNHLGADVTKALGGAVSRADLAAIAGADGQIKGAKEFKALHALLDKADGRADGIASGKLRQADGTVVDSASGPLLQAIQGEVAANRKLPQYAQPGTAHAPDQPRLTVAGDAMTVDPKDQKPVDLKMRGVNQFALYPDNADKGGKACFEAAVKACNDHNAKEHGKAAPKLDGPVGAIQIAYREDGDGRVAIDETQARIGREYIDKALDAGYPAVVGVSYSDEAYNNDRLTDHFVTIDKRGYDDQNRLYYEFKDPGNGGRVGRLYVDADSGKLFKEGDNKGRYVHNADYEVTQVRTYQTRI